MELLEEKKKISNADYFQVAEGIWGMRVLFVNLYMVRDLNSDKWILIDAGLLGFDGSIVKMAEDLFGEGAKPEAIVLTHGHFDHTGAIEELLKHWNVPVYAHKMEFPFLNGKSSYPPADPMAGGGFMAWMSWSYPTSAINISEHLEELKEGEDIPVLGGWKVYHTPGHTPGHISFFREPDKTLIAGDAFVTTQAESATSIMTQKKKICGPPAYLTPDWPSAYKSVHKLAALEPETVATGHGRPFEGEELRKGLSHLAEFFYKEAVPKEGRYVGNSAQANEDGYYYIPPLNRSEIAKVGLGIAAGAIAAYSLVSSLKSRD